MPKFLLTKKTVRNNFKVFLNVIIVERGRTLDAKVLRDAGNFLLKINFHFNRLKIFGKGETERPKFYFASKFKTY